MSGLQFDHIDPVVKDMAEGREVLGGTFGSKSGPRYLNTRESAISMFTSRSKGASG